MAIDNTLSAIRRNSNGFDFVEALGSFVNNAKFNLGLNQSQVGNDSKDAFIWKALSCIGEDYAEIIYENVLNYIDNAANVDLCKVKALQSMIKIVGVKYEVLQSFSNIPVEIANLIDILSINRRYLLDSKTFKSSFYDLLSANGILNQTIQDTVELSSTITLSAIAEGLVHDDSKYINEDQYEQFLKTIYYSVLTSFVYLPYADAENGLPSEHDYIYEYIYNDLITGQMTYDYDQYTQYQSTIAQLKAKYNISKSFNQEAIVDDIENGYDSFDNYNTFEQQILKYEVERRQQTYSAKKEYDQSNATLGFNLTRYSYYREKKVKEYFKFVEDAYNSLIVESDIVTNIDNSVNDSSMTIKPYEHDINYFDIDQQVKKKFLRYEDGVIEVDTAQIVAIAQMLAEQTLAIADIRDQVKLQIRKSYMRGTFLLISYVINEFLKYNVSNKYGSLFTTEDGQTLKDILDTSIMQGGNVQLIEYYDETQYYNITRDVDSKAQYSDTVNEKFWDNIYSQIGKTTNDIPLAEIDNFYLNQLKLKKSSSVDNLVNFLSILYEYGANDSYISRKTGEFTCKIPGKNPGDDPFYIGDPHNEISALENDILSVDKIIDGINIYIEKGYPQGISSTIDQISHLCTWVSSDYFWNEISTANESTKDEVIDQLCADLDHFNETSEKLSEISSTYEDFKTNPKYKYYLGISAFRPYEELPSDQAYFIEKVRNLKLSTQDSSGIIWEHSKLKRDIQYMLNEYNKLSACLYNGLFTLSVWPSDSVITDLGSLYFSQSTTYWPHYSPHFENELTTVTTDLKNYLVGQAQEQHAGAMQHLQNHYDTLLTYKNDLNRVLEDCNDADAKLEAYKDAVAAATGIPNEKRLEQTITYFDKVVDQMSAIVSYEENSVSWIDKDGKEHTQTFMLPAYVDYVAVSSVGYIVATSTYKSPAINGSVVEQLKALQQRCAYPSFPVLEQRLVMVGSTDDPGSVADYHGEVEGYASYVTQNALTTKSYYIDYDDEGNAKLASEIVGFEYYVPNYKYEQRVYTNADIVEHKWNDHYSQAVENDILASYNNAIANLTALVAQVNAELTCLGATSITVGSPTMENVKDLTKSAYSQLVSRLNDLEKKIQASTEADGWQSLANSDNNLQPFKNRLTRINYINSPENALSNIRSIEVMFRAIQLSVQQVLANDSEYFIEFINNEADRLDKQLSAIYAYMLNRDSQASAEVLSTINDISSQYTDELLDFNTYALTVNRKYVDSINDNYTYNLMTIPYMDEVYEKIQKDPVHPHYPAGAGHDDWPTRYRDCLDYLLSGQYITQPRWPDKENGILYWLEKAEKTFEQTAVEQINIKIPQLPDYIQLTSLLDILSNVYIEKIEDEDALLVDKLDVIVSAFKDQISYISSQIPFYDASHTIYLKYNGTEIGYDPFYCYSNMAYSSYQIHPYLYNFVEKSTITYPLASNFFAMFSDYYEREIYSIGIDNMLGKFGNIKELWKNGMFDWTSYQSKYEKDASRAKFNDGSINPNIGFTGLFYPPAIDAFLNNRDQFLQDVQDDSPASYYHHLNLTDNMLQKIYEQLLAYEPMIRDVATAQDTHQLSGEYDIYRYGEDTLGNSLFLLKSYKHLYAQHKDDPNYRPSYHEKRNTPGELWMRVKNHPLAFPAIDLRKGYDDISQYNVKAQVNSTFQNIDINDYMIVLNKYFQSHETIDIFNDNKDSILSVGSITRDTIGHYEIEGKNLAKVDQKHPKEAQHLRCIFDFEFDPMNQAVLLVVPFRTGTGKQTTYGYDYDKDKTKLRLEHMRYANSSVVIAYLGDKVLFNATTDQTYTYIFSKDIYTENLANIDEIENTHMLINGSLEYEGSSSDKRYFTEFIGFAKHNRSIYALFAKKYFVNVGNPQFTFKSSRSAKPHLEIECSRYTCHIPIKKTTIASDALIYDMYDWQQDDDRVKVNGQPLDYSNASNIAVAGGEDGVTVGFVTQRRQTREDKYSNNSQIVNFAEYTSQMESYNAISSAGKNVKYPRSTALIQTNDSQHINIYNSFDSFVQYLVNVNFKFVGTSLKHQSTNYFNLNSDLGYLPQYVDQHGTSHYNNNTALQKKQQYNIELLGPEKSDIEFTPVIKVPIDEKFGRVVEEYKDFNKISAFQKEDIIIPKDYRIATYKFDISSIYIDSLVENGMERSRAESNWQDLIETPELLTYKYIIYNTNYLAMPVLKGNLSDALPNGYYYQGAEAYDLLSGEQAIGPNQTTYQNINLTNHIDNISAITALVEYDVNDTLLPSALTLSCIARMPDQTSKRVINEGTFYMLLYVKNNVKSYQYYHLFENAHPEYGYTVSSDEAWSIDLAKESRDLSDIRIDGTDKYPFRNNNPAKKPDQLSAALEFKYSEENPINREFPNIDPIDVEDEITIVENDSQSIYYFSLDDSSTIELDAFNMEVYAPNQADPKGEGGRIYKKKINPLMPKYRSFYDRALVIEATYNMEKSLDETKYEIVQYFNYKNFTNPQYVNLAWQYDSHGNRIETKPPTASVCDQNDKSIEHTYLVLRPGQSGQLDIRVDFVEYQKLTRTSINQSIVGAYTQHIKTYYIMNVSDEKPKFIISRKPFSSDEGVIETGNYELKDAYYNGMIFQYVMMIIRQTRSSEHTDSPLYNYVAMSRIAFEKSNKEEYEFPTNADVTIADGANVAVVQPNVPKNLLINDDQKEFFASNLSLNEGNNLSILIDLKEPLLDIQQFDHWSWYNSHCSNSHVGYMPKSFILAFSNDKRRWYKADEQTDLKNAWPTTNYAKAYTGKLEIVDG